MDQEKIGKFILENRKDKKITQQELAERLGVSDRTIGNWENGRNLPDVSLFMPLCEELGITINELISGEKIDKSNYEEKFENNVLNTIDYSQKKIKSTKSKFILTILIIFMLISFFIILFLTDINRMKNHEPVFFSTWGFDYYPEITLEEIKINDAIINYETKIDAENKRHDNEKTFVSLKTFLIKEPQNDMYYVYCWVLKENYYYDNNELKVESGSSIPHKFIVKKLNNEYIVSDSFIPRDGSFYVNDMKTLFPLRVRKTIDKVHSDGTVDKLIFENEVKAKLYYRVEDES